MAFICQIQQQQAVQCLEQCNEDSSYRPTVCLKKIPDIFSCNFRKHCLIFIMFGTHVNEKVSNQ